MPKASAYGDEIWQVDSIIRRRSAVHFTQIAQGAFERRVHIPQICIPHSTIPRIPPPPKEDPRRLLTTKYTR
jgi:hypothetical protein